MPNKITLKLPKGVVCYSKKETSKKLFSGLKPKTSRNISKKGGAKKSRKNLFSGLKLKTSRNISKKGGAKKSKKSKRRTVRK
jgi:hypothetical protein